jgi:predicted transcriptional regulator
MILSVSTFKKHKYEILCSIGISNKKHNTRIIFAANLEYRLFLGSKGREEVRQERGR